MIHVQRLLKTRCLSRDMLEFLKIHTELQVFYVQFGWTEVRGDIIIFVYSTGFN